MQKGNYTSPLITIVKKECLPKLQHRPRGNPIREHLLEKEKSFSAFWSLEFAKIPAIIGLNCP